VDRRPRKRVRVHALRGFKSHRYRHLPAETPHRLRGAVGVLLPGSQLLPVVMHWGTILCRLRGIAIAVTSRVTSRVRSRCCRIRLYIEVRCAAFGGAPDSRRNSPGRPAEPRHCARPRRAVLGRGRPDGHHTGGACRRTLHDQPGTKRSTSAPRLHVGGRAGISRPAEDVHGAVADLQGKQHGDPLQCRSAVHVEEVDCQHGRGLSAEELPPSCIGMPRRRWRYPPAVGILRIVEAPTRWPSVRSSRGFSGNPTVCSPWPSG
jgi:hypothetical protein